MISHKNFAENKLLYLQPMQDAKYVNLKDNIIIGFEKPLNADKQDVQKCIEVIGTKSGIHTGEIKFAVSSIIIFNPHTSFAYDEEIYIKISGIVCREIGTKSFQYRFTTSKRKVNYDYRKNGEAEFPGLTDQPFLPPVLNVTVNNNPSPGYFFITPYAGNSNLIIANNNATVYWYRKLSVSHW